MSYDFKKYLDPWKTETFIDNLCEEEYHAEPALSAGQIKQIMDPDGGIHKLHYEKNNPETKKISPAMLIGARTHKAFLEGDEFIRRYRQMPKFTGFTKDGRESTQSADVKAKRAAWILDQPSDAIIVESMEERDQLVGMLNSLAAHPVAQLLMAGSKRELSGFANYEGFRCKIRIDIYNEGLFMLSDLKTTRNAVTSEFHKQITNEMYYVQAAFYLAIASKIIGKQIRTFNAIAVDKEPPYLVTVHEIGESFLTCGDLMIKGAMAKLRAALTSGEWLPEPQLAMTANAPDWLMTKLAGDWG